MVVDVGYILDKDVIFLEFVNEKVKFYVNIVVVWEED